MSIIMTISFLRELLLSYQRHASRSKTTCGAQFSGNGEIGKLDCWSLGRNPKPTHANPLLQYSVTSSHFPRRPQYQTQDRRSHQCGAKESKGKAVAAGHVEE